MKKPKRPISRSFLQAVYSHLIPALVILAITTTVSFAWNTNGRLTKLETALINLAADVHDIKGLLMKH